MDLYASYMSVYSNKQLILFKMLNFVTAYV